MKFGAFRRRREAAAMVPKAIARIAAKSSKHAAICIALVVVLSLVALVAGAYTTSATWYDLTGNTTACGGVMNAEELTAASRDYPCGTNLQVSYGGSSVVVTVTDYGPAAWTGHDIDLSRGAADALGMTSAGVGMVDIQEIGAPSASAPAAATQPRPASASSPSSSASAPAEVSATHSAANHGGTFPTPSGVYYVKYGDTLTSIAYNLGVSLDHLIKSNPQLDPNWIYKGDEVYY